MSDAFLDDRDAVVRAVLAEHGDDGSLPRHTLFFFYGGDVAGLGAAATRAGYRVSKARGRDGVILETTTGVDDATFERLSEQMQAWAEEFGSDYDGRECQVMIN